MIHSAELELNDSTLFEQTDFNALNFYVNTLFNNHAHSVNSALHQIVTPIIHRDVLCTYKSIKYKPPDGIMLHNCSAVRFLLAYWVLLDFRLIYSNCSICKYAIISIQFFCFITL